MKTFVATVLVLLIMVGQTLAGPPAKVVRETAEFLLEKFGVELAEETVETLSSRLVVYGTRYGDEVLEAIQKVGPRGFQLLDDAGENAPAVVQLLTRYGNKAVWVAASPGKLAIFVKYGDEAAEAMMKHPGAAEKVIEKMGQPAARALAAVDGQNARRIAMMSDDGSLVSSGRANELLGVIEKYGNSAADFIWRNKGALAAASVAATFIRDPRPFIDGTVDLVPVVVNPIIDNTKWTVVFAVVLGFGILILAFRFDWFRPKRASSK